MSDVPSEAKPRCPVCKEELPQDDALVCNKCGTLLRLELHRCSTCRAWIPRDTNKCTRCDSFFDWRRWSVVVPVAVGLLTILSLSVALALGVLRRNSYTEAWIVGSSPLTLNVGIVNSGYASSLVRRDFKVEMTVKPSLVNFGSLNLVSKDEARLLRPNQSATLAYEIDRIQSPCDLDSAKFWASCGAQTVKLTGEAEESNGKVRHLEHIVPLREIKLFVQTRKNPPPKPKDCTCKSD